MNAASTSPTTQTYSSPSPNSYISSETGKKAQQAMDEQKIVEFVRDCYARAKAARSEKQSQWYLHMSFFFGKHWAEIRTSGMQGDFAGKLTTPNAPYYKKRKTVNRTRAFVRTELAKFLSTIPTITSVPGTGEDQDVRAAYAAEQAWISISEGQKLRTHFSRAMWWMIITGNGFVKTQWDKNAIDKASGQKGTIKYNVVKPFNLFVGDLREQDMEEQPYVIEAYVKPVEWCRSAFSDRLGGKQLYPSVASSGGNSMLDEGYLNLTASSGNKPDSCIVYEAWIKPGTTPLLPQGGVVIMVDDVLVSLTQGMPYKHGMYPYTKFEHIPTSTFYADSPLADFIALNREYNESRTDIAEAARRMGRPQLLAQRGSVVAQKITNEAGLIIEYKQGTPPPQPLPLMPLPQYVIDQQDRILMDMEDVSGQHDVTRGQAPAGITAGTAISYLGERDDQFRTPEYQSIEDGYEKIAGSTLELFVQYVDVQRKIKVIGADMAFDTMSLAGSDISGGTDVRTEAGSSIGTSKAAQDAKVNDMFAIGLIDQNTALRLMEVGGMNKVLDILHVAEKKAQRENTKMKALTVELIQQSDMLAQQQQMMDPMGAPVDPMHGTPADPEGMADPGGMNDDPMADPAMGMMPPPPPPPVIAVDDFDVHEIHIETHNKFRMSQEYEMLAPEVKDQFARHVQEHEQMFMQKQMTEMMNSGMMGGMGDPNAAPGAAPGADPAAGGGSDAMMSGNGQVPDMTGGGPNG